MQRSEVKMLNSGFVSEFCDHWAASESSVTWVTPSELFQSVHESPEGSSQRDPFQICYIGRIDCI